MKPIIPNLVKEMGVLFKEDAKQKGLMHAQLEKQLISHKKFEQLRADWAEKRVASIFREVARYGVKITGTSKERNWRRSVILSAQYQDVTMEGELSYMQMDMIRPFKAWKRPKIVLSFWVLDSKGERCYLEGHHSEALKIVFGTKRMMTYNRLAPAFLSAIAR